MPKKYAFIRSETSGKSCPFGLPIATACSNAGDSVSNMCPLEFVEDEEKQGMVAKANKRVYVYYKTGSRCLYAANVMKEKETVNCDFGDTGMGIHMDKAPEGSPLYAQTFAGVGLDGLYAFPLGFYADNNESRNLFQGLFSLVGNRHSIDIIKEAVNTMPEELTAKLDSGEELTDEERQNLFRSLEECRQSYEDQRSDSGKMNEIANKWNPRKKL